MNRRGRSRFGGSPEIYYYNSARRDAVGELAGQLSGLIQEEMTRRHKKKLVFLCIGTDRSTGDSLGPLIGYKLKQERRRGTLVFGTLDRPVHAMNLEHYVQVLKNGYPDALVVAVDASVGDENHVGYVTLGRTGSDRYTPQDSLALTRLMYDTRMSWGMKFAGEV